ncbi:tyrosine-type recombinase/integrase [Enterobacter ludwigii]|uniref:tyrosine-type recombinase/integrase n=1 Tax=Enterobacter ludwigii TaxID=299767 RepID=UPI003975F7FF
MPVLFRTIYACGLRCSEARLLRVEDVVLATGVLLNRDAKGGKDRQIPVSESLRIRLVHYHAQFDWMRHKWFFPGRHGLPLRFLNVYNNFPSVSMAGTHQSRWSWSRTARPRF